MTDINPISIHDIYKEEKQLEREHHYKMLEHKDSVLSSIYDKIRDNSEAFYKEDGSGILSIGTIRKEVVEYFYDDYNEHLRGNGFQLRTELKKDMRSFPVNKVMGYSIVRYSVPEKQKNVERKNWIRNALNFFGGF